MRGAVLTAQTVAQCGPSADGSGRAQHRFRELDVELEGVDLSVIAELGLNALTVDDPAPWIDLAGRLHPALVQLPTGLLVALVVMELWALVRRRALNPGTRRVLAGLVALSLVVAATSGWLLADAEPYPEDTLRLHRVGGAVFGLMGLVMAGTSLLRGKAYVKALGTGLATPLDVFDVSLEKDAGFVALRDGQDQAQWGLWDVSPGPDYVAAVAAPLAGSRVLTFRFSGV